MYVVPLLLFALSCDDDGSIDCCVDGSSSGAVAGVVLDGDQVPLEGVDLEAINFQSECDGFAALGPFASARTDANGEFVMSVTLPLMAPTLYCFDMAIARGDSSDTIPDLQVRTFDAFPPTDTTRVTFQVAW